MRLNLGMPFEFCNLKGMIFGGPFREYVQGTRRLIGIKMAEEIDHPHEVSVPTMDYSVPDVGDMQAGMIAALQAFHDGSDVYAGCMGGIGRTGLFMGCMAKLMIDLEALPEGSDPVAYVRKHYKSHAIETREQQDYVRTFDTSPVIAEAMRLTGKEVKVVEIEIVKEIVRVITPLEWMFPWAFSRK